MIDRRRIAAGAFAILLPLCGAVGAEEADAPPETPGGAPEATFYGTATVEQRPLDSATAEVTILDRDLIESLGARTVGELLRFAPGVDVTGNGTRGGLSTARIRGGDPNFTLVLIDGVAVNDGTYQVGEVFNLEGLPTAAIERIEIVRGPLSSFYGSTGLAGAIHVITRSGSSEAPRLSAEVVAGGAQERAVHLTAGGATRSADYFVALSGAEESGRVAEERFELFQVQGRGGVRLSDRAAVELAARLAWWEGDDYPEASGGPLFGSGELRSAENAEMSFGARLSLGGEAGRGQKVHLGFYRHALERASPAIFPLVPPAAEDTTFTRLRLGWSTTLRPRDGVQLGLGLDLEGERGVNRSLLLLPPFLGGAVRGDYALERTTPGVYGEVVARRGALAIEAGARLDLPEGVSERLSPRLGATYRLSEKVRLRASAGRSFKLPSFFASASPPQLGGNPELRPEVMTGGDAEVAFRFPARRLDAGLAVFYSRYRDLVDFDFDAFTHLNRSRVEARGAEGRISWRPSARLALALDVTRQSVEDLDTGRQLRERPRWVAGLRIDYRPSERWALHLDSQGVSERRDDQIPVPQIDTVAGYQLWGLTASWRAMPGLRLALRADNLADREYQTQIGFPGAGRSLRLSLRYETRQEEREP